PLALCDVEGLHPIAVRVLRGDRSRADRSIIIPTELDFLSWIFESPPLCGTQFGASVSNVLRAPVLLERDPVVHAAHVWGLAQAAHDVSDLDELLWGVCLRTDRHVAGERLA